MNLSSSQTFNRDYSDPRSPFNNIGMYSSQQQNIPIDITNYSYGTIAVPVNHSGLSYQTSYYEHINRQNQQNRQNRQNRQNESYNQNRTNIQQYSQYSLSSNTRNERNRSRRNNKCFDCCVIS